MLELCDISKEYDRQPLLKHVSFSVEKDETICLLGPSGSGKSTLLRMIAGIESPDSGDIRWNGKSILPVSIHQRCFGLMFQDYALFPHLNVFENTAFGLRLQKKTFKELSDLVHQALKQVGMDSFAGRQISDLSGGEQQRVALARTLAAKPQLLLLDEPLAALDRVLRKQLLTEIRQILHSERIPAIYVTHDQEEAYLIADRVLLLGQGTILQTGTPAEVYHHPVNLEAAQFLGLKNILPAMIEDGQLVTEIGILQPTTQEIVRLGAVEGEKVTILIRGVELGCDPTERKVNQFTARVKDVFFQEDHTLVVVQAGNFTFEFALSDFAAGLDQVELVIPQDKIQLFKS